MADDLVDALERWMAPSEFASWEAGHRSGRIARTGAKHFIAADGKSTVAVPQAERAVFLHLAGHEFVEAALDDAHDQQGHAVDDRPTDEGISPRGLWHLIWTEYVVERVRHEAARGLGWPCSTLDRGWITGQLQDFARELPALIRWAVAHDAVPQRAWQHWAELALTWPACLGRAADGCPAAHGELKRFNAHPLAQETIGAWETVKATLSEIWDAPDRPAVEHDDRFERGGWYVLYEAFADLWNTRYAAAQG
ncbi:MAG TPA: hypothetical protein VNT54_13685 [Solirubrobacteraceae bacterium]|nr:hypothetical protein [Solirubrobacteraceae bacterium]